MLETPVFSRGIEILTEKDEFTLNPPPARRAQKSPETRRFRALVPGDRLMKIPIYLTVIPSLSHNDVLYSSYHN